MAEKSRFFDVELVVNGVPDREYPAKDYADYFDTLVSTGVFAEQLDSLELTGSGNAMQTILAPGKAFIKGYYYENDSPLTLTHEFPDPTQNRTDLVILRMDKRVENRYVKAFVITGTPGMGSPELVLSDDVYEIAIAEVLIIAGKSFIDTTEVTDAREYATYRTKPAWYPEGQVPMDAWMYVNFRDQLTTQEIADIEANPSLMSIINSNTSVNIITPSNKKYSLYIGGKTVVTTLKGSKDTPNVIGSSKRGIDDGVYIYAYIITGYIYKIRKEDGVIVAVSSLIGTIQDIDHDATYLYAVGGEFIYRISKSTLISTSYNRYTAGSLVAVCVLGSYVYIAGYTKETIVVLLKSNLSVVSETTSYYEPIRSIITDDTWLWIHLADGELKRLTPITLAQQAFLSSTVPTSGYSIIYNQYLLIASGEYIYKYDKNTLTHIATLDLGTTTNAGDNSIYVDGGFIYYGNKSGGLYIIDIEDFSYINTDAPMLLLYSDKIIVDDGNIWIHDGVDNSISVLRVGESIQGLLEVEL
ncbi:MAG: hypothetical protein K9L62_02245 [Vallitaleaceae bacterium]|nr:hypothetical protein [Vallitaleaceae bacterium]